MIRKIVLALVALVSMITYAQDGASSPYSFYGLGTLQFQGTVENRTMGGMTTYSDSLHVNLRNPAGYGALRFTNFAVGASHKEVQFTTNEIDEDNSNTTIDYVAIGIPIGKKWGVGFGILPYSSVGYNIQNIDEEIGTSARFSGSGGLNKAYLSAGYEILPDLRLGGTVSYNFGSIRNLSIIGFEGLELGTQEINRSDLSGLSLNFGAQFEADFSKDLRFYANAAYTMESNLNSENSRELASVLFISTGDVVPVETRNVIIADTDLTLPSSVVFGFGLGEKNKWFAGTEVSLEETSNFSNRSFSIPDVTYKNAAKYRLGGFYTPEYLSVNSYWKRMTYRAGVRYEELGLNIRGQDISEFGMSFGVGLPAGRSLSNVNLGFEYGQRGTTEAGLIKENFFNVFLSLSFNGKWFQKLKFN
ncbi:hypothetical protein [Croceiramulus getboli]|nr:hypothetical protein P8624_02245 [Flavobacteriaceae bacterium YJPT1-3]